MKGLLIVLFALVLVPLFAGNRRNLQTNDVKTIFINNCGPCHKPNMPIVGPSLQPVILARDRQWIINYIWDDEALQNTNDSITLTLKQNGKVQYHHNFKANLTKEGINEILNYIEAYK